jgi:hypothetical protein
LRQCSIPLADDDKPARYNVRLFFSEPDDAEPGQRVFDVKLQGETVTEQLDIRRATGGRNRTLVMEYPGVEAGRTLEVALVPTANPSSPEQQPVLQAIEIVRVGGP